MRSNNLIHKSGKWIKHVEKFGENPRLGKGFLPQALEHAVHSKPAQLKQFIARVF